MNLCCKPQVGKLDIQASSGALSEVQGSIIPGDVQHSKCCWRWRPSAVGKHCNLCSGLAVLLQVLTPPGSLRGPGCIRGLVTYVREQA